jgi:ParB-like chromosome segregation protein Spo0J
MEFHGLANIFPLMSGEEFAALKEDIRRHGQREPIWTHEGKIIDGRNRYRACSELGIEPLTREWDRNGSLVTFILSLNLHRRHLSSSQKAIIALDVEKHLATEAKERQRQGGGDHNKKAVSQKLDQPDRNAGKATAQAAALVGTNRQYVSAAKKLAATTPDLIPVVRDGIVTIEDAKQLASLPEAQRTSLVEKLASGEAKNFRDAIRSARRASDLDYRELFTAMVQIEELGDEETELRQFAEAVKKGELEVTIDGFASSDEPTIARYPLLRVKSLAEPLTGQTWHWPKYSGAATNSFTLDFKTYSEDLSAPLFTPDEWEEFTSFDEAKVLSEFKFPGYTWFDWWDLPMRVPVRSSILRKPRSTAEHNQRSYDPLFGRMIVDNHEGCKTCPRGPFFIRRGWGEWVSVEFNDGEGGRVKRRYFRHDHAGASFIQQAGESVDPLAFSHANFQRLRLHSVMPHDVSWAYIRRKTIPREAAIAALEADLEALRGSMPLNEAELTERALEWLQAFTPKHPDEWREGTCTYPRNPDGTVDVAQFQECMDIWKAA